MNPGLLNLYRQQLRAARIRQGVTMPQLSHWTGLSESFLDHCERGTRNPSFATLRKWAGALRFDFENTVKPQAAGSNNRAGTGKIRTADRGAPTPTAGLTERLPKKGVRLMLHATQPPPLAHCVSAQSSARGDQ